MICLQPETCRIYFPLARSPLELAQELPHVAMALHIAERSTPVGVTRRNALEFVLPIAVSHALPFAQRCGSSCANVSACSVETTYLLGAIGDMLTQHEVCLDVSVGTTLGYRPPASCELAAALQAFPRHCSSVSDL